MVLQSIVYEPGSLKILNQLKLPHTTVYDTINNSTDAWHAIKEMRTRGAPAIALVAALGLVVELTNTTVSSIPEELQVYITEKINYLVTSRPTAVNLADAAKKLKTVVEDAVKIPGATGDSVRAAYVKAAERMLVDDVNDNVNIGKHGADWIIKNTPQGQSGKVSMLTHCNTGYEALLNSSYFSNLPRRSLATAGYGTALGVIRALHERQLIKHAFCTETRPYNQGSRLTAYELVHDGIPATLITDSMAAALLRLRGSTENLAAIVVGADRVAANGDTANKIGTYALVRTCP